MSGIFETEPIARNEIRPEMRDRIMHAMKTAFMECEGATIPEFISATLNLLHHQSIVAVAMGGTRAEKRENREAFRQAVASILLQLGDERRRH